MWLTMRGYVAGAVAFVACPCHLPVTLPLLLSLTAGTGLGVWLAGNTITVVVISTGLFIAGLSLAFRWMSETSISCDTSRTKASQPGQTTGIGETYDYL